MLLPDEDQIDPQTGEPFNRPPAVLIQISMCKCRGCGHAWTHSQLCFRTEDNSYAYDITPEREKWLLRNPELVEGRHEIESLFPVCHRCVKPGIGKGWKSTRGEKIHPTLPVKYHVPASGPVDENGFVIVERPDLNRFFETTMPRFKGRKNSKHLKPKVQINLLED